MQLVPIAVLAALALLAAPAAASGINLFANDCSAGPTATNAVSNTCLSDAGTAFSLVGSMVMPAMTLHQFSGCQSILDVETDATGTIQDWWRADTCRPAAFVVYGDAIGIGGTCATVWDLAPPIGTSFNAVFAAGAPPDRIRYLIATTLDPTAAASTDLTGDGTTEWSVFRLTVTRAKTLAPNGCAGCLAPACLVLNEINVRTLTDTPDTWLRLTNPLAGAYVIYNGPMLSTLCPDAVPVRPRTWGAVKALYR